jgi:RimJ/RimL family protein N-acetyltransferase
VHIRRARAEDAEALIAHANAVGAEGIYIMTERVERSLNEERALIRKSDGRSSLWIVAVAGGEILGVADIGRGRHSKNRHVANLGIALRKDARRVGLGTEMRGTLIEWAQSVRVRKLTLGVFATNTAARALYRRLGFVQEGRLKGQVILRGKPVDELLLARWL